VPDSGARVLDLVHGRGQWQGIIKSDERGQDKARVHGPGFMGRVLGPGVGIPR